MSGIAATGAITLRPAVAGTGGRALRRFLQQRMAVAGAVFLVLLVLGAIFAPWVAPHDPEEVFWDAVRTPPSAEFWLGTDEIGRDIVSRLIFGARVSLQIVFGAIAIALGVGATIGLVSGHVGGWLDDIVMRVADGLQAFPSLILALAVVAVLGPSVTNAMLAIALTNIPEFARLVRGQVLLLREQDYVQAARAIGASDLRIMAYHLWPSVVGSVVVYASLRTSGALLAESSLAFLGLGAAPPTPSWGQMLATSLSYLSDWWIGVFPGLTIFVAVLAFNFIGDGMRDAFDTRSR
ncbi:MAG TPA: ABC transporter permease [Acetobacteraceae bacterium]|nr:ABC transporter permease [Acetobacteraceae bacterium]